MKNDNKMYREYLERKENARAKAKDRVASHFEKKYSKVANEVLLSEKQLTEQKVAGGKRRQALVEAKKEMTSKDLTGYVNSTNSITRKLHQDENILRGGSIGTVIGAGVVAATIMATHNDPTALEVVSGTMIAGVIPGSLTGVAGGMLKTTNDQTRFFSKAKNSVEGYFRDKYTSYQESKLEGITRALDSQIEKAEENNVVIGEELPSLDVIEEIAEKIEEENVNVYIEAKAEELLGDKETDTEMGE